MSELVPYELRPEGDEPPDELAVHMGGGRDGEPERLLHLSRPVDGLVRVREWTGADWNAPAVEREMPADVLLRAFEEGARQRRRLSEELYAIRLWLTGRPD
jgi:hypothetical protein